MYSWQILAVADLPSSSRVDTSFARSVVCIMQLAIPPSMCEGAKEQLKARNAVSIPARKQVLTQTSGCSSRGFYSEVRRLELPAATPRGTKRVSLVATGHTAICFGRRQFDSVGCSHPSGELSRVCD
eukprot:TRINITY_DN865_c0_g1_i1.p1 TRINITY_DN865_c0_g1~~TRINITY_DN865_c0_g1_i1.p1  ORF type:complete len:127 (+),score=3.69 TRINITY_DN865_c0_g1_i1:96-476(+)